MAISVRRFWAWPDLEPFEATGLFGPNADALIEIFGSKVRIKDATAVALASESFLLRSKLPVESVKPFTTNLVNPWVSMMREMARISLI